MDNSGGERRPLSDPQRIFEVLARHGVDYVVIGGVAVIAHGHIRATADVDFVAGIDHANIERLAAALRELRAELRGVDANLLGIDVSDPETLAAGGNFTMTTDAGHLDYFSEVPGGVPYPRLRRDAIEVELDGVPIVIAAIDDLIRMKAAAGRPQDHMDIAALRDIARRAR